MSSNEIERFLDVAVRRGLYGNRRALRNHTSYIFGGVDRFDRCLDIGGGEGLLSFYLAARGGGEVICLEPEADGATAAITAQFAAVAADMGYSDRVSLRHEFFQDFDPAGRRFDLIVSANAINHLDEDACMALGKDPAARARYQALFVRLYELLEPGGWLILSDCTRHNLFPLLGLTNPLMPTIEWHKHQSPYVWRELGRSAGFAEARIQWSSLNRLGRLGRLLMGNAVVNHLTLSHFRLAMRRPR